MVAGSAEIENLVTAIKEAGYQAELAWYLMRNTAYTLVTGPGRYQQSMAVRIIVREQ